MIIKRSKYLFFFFRNFPVFKFENFENENLEFENQIILIPILNGEELVISFDEFNWLISIEETHWTDKTLLQHQTNLVEKFAAKGVILLRDSKDPIHIEFVRNEELVINQKWHIYAVLFNFMTKWKDVNVSFNSESVKLDSKEEMKVVIDESGFPPLHYHQLTSFLDKVDLNLTNVQNDEFFNVLTKRKTTRNFDRFANISFQDLSLLLKYTFGFHGVRSLYDSDIVSVKKTSPSGGGMHCTEVYLLVIRVNDLTPGYYHYNTNEDRLYLIKSLSNEEITQRVIEFTAGQEYCTDSSVLFFMTQRYFRSFWKYRKNSSVFSVLLREIGHLSQTMYLIATKLNLGVFTAALNQINVEKELGLNPFEHGVVSMIGVGVKDENPLFNLEPVFNEFIPKKE